MFSLLTLGVNVNNVTICLMLLYFNNKAHRGVNCMLPIERQNQIKKLIQEKENIKISELSKNFSVSEMTIHRDLKPLIAEGLIVKTFGGISLAQNYQSSTSQQICVYCCRDIVDRV